MVNNEIDENKKEILEERLIWINDTISRIDSERGRYGNDYLSAKYDKLISQKEKIVQILNHSEK
jgi:uncharacterized protein YPO0396